MSFDAGSIESRLDLDRTPFQRGLAEADREAREFSSKRIAPVIDIDTARAKTDLDDIDEKLKTTGRQRPRPKVSPETDGAQEVLAKLRAELLALGAETTRVKTDVDDEKSRVKILGLEAQLARLGARVAQPRISVAGAAEAEFQIAKIKAQLDGLGGDRATPSARVGDGGGNNSGKGFLQGGVSGPSNILTAAAAGIPTLIPVVATLTAGVGALASMFTAAGVGAAGFALLAKPQLEAVSKAQTQLATAQDAYNKATTDKGRANALRDEYLIYAQLTPQQREYMTQLNGLKGVYKDLQASVSTPVFSVAASVMHALGTAGALLEPVFQAAGDTFVELGQQFDTWVSKSAGLRSFVDFLTRQTGPALYTLAHSLGDVARGFGGILMAFEPLLGPLEHGMQSFTEKFAAWGAGLGSSAGFQSFLDYVRANAPAVGHMFEQLAKAVGTIVTQLAPFGPIGLQLITMLAELINQNPELVKVAASLILVWKSVSLASGAAKGITSLVTNFKDFAALFKEGGALAKAAPMLGSIAVAAGPVIIALAGLAIGGYLLYTHWHQIIGFIERDWKNLLLLIPVLGPVMSLVAHNWNAIWDAMSTTVSHVWAVIRAVVSGGAGFISGVVGATVRAIQGAWNSTWNAVAGATSFVWAVIRNVVSSGVSGVLAAVHGVSAVVGIIGGAFQSAYNAVVQAISGILSYVGGLPGAVMGALGDLSGILINAGEQIIGGLLSGITSKFEDVKNFVGGIAGWISSHKGPLDYDARLLIPHGNAIMAGLVAGLRGGMGMLQSQIGDVNGVLGNLSGGGVSSRAADSRQMAGRSTRVTQNFIYRGPLTPQVVSEARRQLDFAVGA